MSVDFFYYWLYVLCYVRVLLHGPNCLNKMNDLALKAYVFRRLIISLLMFCIIEVNGVNCYY